MVVIGKPPVAGSLAGEGDRVGRIPLSIGPRGDGAETSLPQALSRRHETWGTHPFPLMRHQR